MTVALHQIQGVGQGQGRGGLAVDADFGAVSHAAGGFRLDFAGSLVTSTGRIVFAGGYIAGIPGVCLLVSVAFGIGVFTGIDIICFIAIIVVTVSYFFGGSESVYGDRLDGIEDHPIEDSFVSEYSTNLESDDMIESVEFDTKGRIIYITINFVGDTSLVEAQSKTAASLEIFSDDLLSYYDINFTITSEATDNSDGFTLMGARNVAGSGLVWNNNTPVESEEE